MTDFLGRFLKIKSDFNRQMRIIFILDVICIFCIFYFLSFIFNIGYFIGKSPLISQIPVNILLPFSVLTISLICAFLLHRKDKKTNVAVLIEKRYSQLNERLRTAYDNRNESNVIVESLKDYVYDALGKVSSIQLFKKSIHTKILVSITFILAISLVVFISGIRVPTEDVARIAGTISGAVVNLSNETSNVVEDYQTSEKKAENTGLGNISGEPTIAPVEGILVDMALDGVGEPGNIPKDYIPEQNQFIRSMMFPVDIPGSNVSDGGFGALMKKSEPEKELINRYAVEISKK